MSQQNLGGFLCPPIADCVLSVPKAVMPSAELIPMLGGLWVLTNAALGGLGSSIDWPVTCAFVAGWINGSVLAGIALATASERFQAGTGGTAGWIQPVCTAQRWEYGLEITEGLHNFVDNAFRAMGIEINERHYHASSRRLSIESGRLSWSCSLRWSRSG
jgi:hypothetical protein